MGKKEFPKIDPIIQDGINIYCAHRAMVPLETLRKYLDPKNRNEHPTDQIDELVEQYKFQGVRHPIIVSTLSGMVKAGDGRFQAADRIGMKAFPVDFQPWDSEDKEYAFGVADNAIQAWSRLDLKGINLDLQDLDGALLPIERLAIKGFELEPADKYADQDADAVPEPAPEPVVKRGEIYILGSHRLMCGDSTCQDDVAALMNGEKAEFCFTSPPYSDQRDYGGNLKLEPAHLSKFLEAPCALFAVNLGMQRKDGQVFPYWNAYLEKAKALQIPFLSWNVWDKDECGSIGNQSAMFGIRHEWIFVFGEKRQLNLTNPNRSAGRFDKYNGHRNKDGTVERRDLSEEIRTHRQLDTVINIQPVKERKQGFDHPAMFPVALAEEYIKACSGLNASVLEPFCGSGSTLIACEKTNRKCYGMEIDPIYCGVILDRWAKFTGKDPHREDGIAWSEIKANGG